MWQVCIGHLMLARLSGRQNSINEAPIWKATQDVDGETSEHWRTCWGLHQNHLWGYSAGLHHSALLGWSSGLTHTCLGRDWTQGPGEASHKGKSLATLPHLAPVAPSSQRHPSLCPLPPLSSLSLPGHWPASLCLSPISEHIWGVVLISSINTEFTQKTLNLEQSWPRRHCREWGVHKRDTDVKNRLLDSVGEGEGGMIWENSIETYIWPYVK